MNTAQDLKEILRRIEGRPYPAYKDTRGTYAFGPFLLSIDHVQGDPFAAPSDVSVLVKDSGFPAEILRTRQTRIAAEDRILRFFGQALHRQSRPGKGSGKSGKLSVTRPGQEILERTSCHLYEDGSVRVRFNIGFPANGRRILARELERILFVTLPTVVNESLIYKNYTPKMKEELQETWQLAMDQTAIRDQLKVLDLAAFVADGSILPRESGVSQKPMQEAVAFAAPESLAVEVETPFRGRIRGLGIRKGVTLIAGGGYHGKSTLLEALERGVYDHIAGDGRELVITDETAVKSRAEDGRSVQDVNISGFITNLPNGKDTVAFSTEDASGSTSQAAGLAEAIEAGTKTLLMDEDTSAANFMIRDNLMQEVVHGDQEPIIPFMDRVRELYEKDGISTILVAGSSGAFFSKADTVIQMDQYVPLDITEKAKNAAKAYVFREKENLQPFDCRSVRIPHRVKESERSKVRSRGMDTISVDRQDIDMRYVEQLVDPEQLAAIGQLLKLANREIVDDSRTLTEVVDVLEDRMNAGALDETVRGHGARPRKQEILAAFNRQRFQKITPDRKQQTADKLE
ncbi:ABC-ATPase domain-containing protein [Faecalibaculum rodentium]|uniref:Isopentenyl-diphosphate delta-isomerase n=1 Tax=Faecalibaculum rodentium TaxID=1702221 RepID=A0A1Q9YLU2_9FIRM|nr:ABC-ATPase domain-containing protein [Faecalibaculum rodentium]OLU45895.1 isopentenyl-diphosphate delta-isomerase [Faecalibaculum rodentium]